MRSVTQDRFESHLTEARPHTGLPGEEFSQALLRGEDIVCFGSGKWYETPTVPEYTMVTFALHNRVLYVEPFVSLLNVLSFAWLRKKRPSLCWGLRQTNTGVVVFSPFPFALPFQHRSRLILRINTLILIWLVTRAMKRLHFRRPIVWIYLLRLAGIVGKLSEKAAVYDCIEDEEFFADAKRTKRTIRQLEDALCRQVDAVFVLNQQLYETKRHLNPVTIIAPAGVNVGHFGKAVLPDTPIPEDLQSLPRPIIGYFGQADPWKIDVDLLVHVARSRPNWSVVLVGHSYGIATDHRIQGLRNLLVLGTKPYTDIPGYLKAFDVCMLPLLLTDGTRNGTPLKLFEYLAAGKPIVSTDIPAAHLFPDLVHVSASHADFVPQVEAACAATSSDLVEQRLSAARENSWEKRAAIMGRVCKELNARSSYVGMP